MISLATMTEVVCPNCGICFCVPKDYESARRNDKKAFFCPNQHSMSFRESDADVLRRERDSLKQQTARLEDENREQIARALKAEAAMTAIKRRVGAGVCPCCTRSFANLAAHVADKHPEIAPRRLSVRRAVPKKQLAIAAPK